MEFWTCYKYQEVLIELDMSCVTWMLYKKIKNKNEEEEEDKIQIVLI